MVENVCIPQRKHSGSAHFFFLNLSKENALAGWDSAYNFLLSDDVVPVPSGPPRKVEVEAVNSTSVKVSWRSPVPNKQHGQIRGYQVHYVRMENGEPKGQPMLKDVMLADAQVSL